MLPTNGIAEDNPFTDGVKRNEYRDGMNHDEAGSAGSAKARWEFGQGLWDMISNPFHTGAAVFGLVDNPEGVEHMVTQWFKELQYRMPSMRTINTDATPEEVYDENYTATNALINSIPVGRLGRLPRFTRLLKNARLRRAMTSVAGIKKILPDGGDIRTRILRHALDADNLRATVRVRDLPQDLRQLVRNARTAQGSNIRGNLGEAILRNIDPSGQRNAYYRIPEEQMRQAARNLDLDYKGGSTRRFIDRAGDISDGRGNRYLVGNESKNYSAIVRPSKQMRLQVMRDYALRAANPDYKPLYHFM
ncbi:MAG: hypothetical protein KDK30_14725, partial [Leptospiraceae bacterium]|nr:hypothetical protein [Leptospiraceae bacterium]